MYRQYFACKEPLLISNYWMRLSRIWRILQIKEGVIHLGLRPLWITTSLICRILHILRKPNSIIALLFIQNIYSFSEGVSPFRSLFFRSPCPQVFAVNGSIICSGLHFWRHFDIFGSMIFGGLHFWRHWLNMAKILSKFGEQQLVMVNCACDFNQSETGKYFEWIIINNYSMSTRWVWDDINCYKQSHIQQVRME